MADDFSKTLTVSLEPHDIPQKVDTPFGIVDGFISFNQFRVLVECSLPEYAGKQVHVGYLGKQDGANFCALPLLYKFYGPQRDWIAEQAKKLHGKASTEPWQEVPPP